MKYFISLPMNGREDFEIRDDMEYVKSQIRKTDKKAEFIDSLFDFTGECKNLGVKFLGMSIEKLADADVAVFYGDWENARGCVIEHAVCVKYAILRKHMEARHEN